jgi:hypothetical protein
MQFAVESAVGYFRDWEGIGGLFKPADHKVVVRREDKNHEATYTHEILHGLSQSLESGKLDFSDPELTPDGAKMLTEAVIEEITQFSQPGESTTYEYYVAERSKILTMLRRIMTFDPKKEIPLAVFARALFSEDKSLRTVMENPDFEYAKAADWFLPMVYQHINENAAKIVEQRKKRKG